MAHRSNRLPSRFPVGTKYVIEGKPRGEGQMQVYTRHLEFPDGTLVPLPMHLAQRKPAGNRRPVRSGGRHHH